MSESALYAITAPITALITCAFITMFIKKLKLRPVPRCIVVFVVYILFIFVMGANGYGIANMDFATYNWLLFTYRAVAGACVSLFLLLFYSRGEIAQKIQDIKDAKKK